MKNNNSLYLDIHVIQTLPPSCVNRDDTGSPKSCVYGGVPRARVSSQCWKRAVRKMFENMDCSSGLRTYTLPSLVAQNLEQKYPEIQTDADAVAAELLACAGLKLKMPKKTSDEDKPKTGALFFVSHSQINALTDLIRQEDGTVLSKQALAKMLKDDKNFAKDFSAKCKEAISKNPSIDIALFGRMVADEPMLNSDACAQVAHAISTHKVNTEYDYFTAVDDCCSEDSSGAAHIGVSEFNSSTLYRYANVNVTELTTLLGSDAPHAISCFVEAFAMSMPTGKMNSFASRTTPHFVYVTLRSDQPVNFVGAFEKPVRAGDSGFADKSVEALVAWAKDACSTFVEKPVAAWNVGKFSKASETDGVCGKSVNLKEMLGDIEQRIASETEM